jgi:hypothetical protein
MAVDVNIPVDEVQGRKRRRVPFLILLSLLIVAALVIVAFLTFEIWAPHVGYHR